MEPSLQQPERDVEKRSFSPELLFAVYLYHLREQGMSEESLQTEASTLDSSLIKKVRVQEEKVVVNGKESDHVESEPKMRVVKTILIKKDFVSNAYSSSQCRWDTCAALRAASEVA